MTNIELFEILGNIDNTDAKPSKSFKWVKWASACACFAIIAAVSIPIINNSTAVNEDNMRVTMPATQSKEEFSHQVIHLPNQPYREGEILADPPVLVDAPADVSGTPLTDAVNPHNLSNEAAAVFGGSYLDENGNFVVVLTNDTPENRSLICRELGRKETTVTFKTGTYTLLYLTNLQNKISNGMANNDLTGITSSAVMETTNNIEVTVLLDNEETIEKLNALDNGGGALDIKEVCIDYAPTEDLLSAE